MSETNDNADTVLDDNEDTVLFDDAGDTDTLLNELDGASLLVQIEDPELGGLINKGMEYLSGPFPRDERSPIAPLPPPELADGYTIESRAESMTVVTLGNAVRRGDLDMVQIGDAGVTDVVTGAETTTLSGTLREHTGGSLVHVADRVETTVGGRMSLSTMGEDSVLLGGPMTDTWAGGTFVLAVMSDDLCAGAGTRVTAPVDLWLNALTGMEERPGTTAADGVFVEAYGTLFEREYGSGIHAAGVATFNGAIYQTQKTGFRPLMKVATGVRNLVSGSGAPASESPPPSPPSDPASVASTALAAGGIVMVGAAGARTAANMSLSADNLADFVRAGRMAGDVDNAADLRHAADTAAQLEELKTAANQGGDLGDARRLDDMGEENPYDEIGGGANRGDSSSPEDSYSTVDESNPNRGDPGGVENNYSQIDGSDPNAGNPGGTASPEGTPPVLPSANRMEDQVRKAKTDLQIEWKKQYTEMFAEASRIEATEPGRADALRMVATELQYAADAVANGEDARPNLAQRAEYLDRLGYPEEAAKLRKASEAFTQFVESMRGLGPGGGLPQGVLSPSPKLLKEGDVGKVQSSTWTLFTDDELRAYPGGVVTDVSPSQIDGLELPGIRRDRNEATFDNIMDEYTNVEWMQGNRSRDASRWDPLTGPFRPVNDGDGPPLPLRSSTESLADADAGRHAGDAGSLNRGGDGSMSDELRQLDSTGGEDSTRQSLTPEETKNVEDYKKSLMDRWDSRRFPSGDIKDGRDRFAELRQRMRTNPNPDTVAEIRAWTEAFGQLEVGILDVKAGKDPRPEFLSVAKRLADLGFDDAAALLRAEAQQYTEFLKDVEDLVPPHLYPPPGVLSPPAPDTPSAYDIAKIELRIPFNDDNLDEIYDSLNLYADLNTFRRDPPPRRQIRSPTAGAGGENDQAVRGRMGPRRHAPHRRHGSGHRAASDAGRLPRRDRPRGGRGGVRGGGSGRVPRRPHRHPGGRRNDTRGPQPMGADEQEPARPVLQAPDGFELARGAGVHRCGQGRAR